KTLARVGPELAELPSRRTHLQAKYDWTVFAFDAQNAGSLRRGGELHTRFALQAQQGRHRVDAGRILATEEDRPTVFQGQPRLAVGHHDFNVLSAKHRRDAQRTPLRSEASNERQPTPRFHQRQDLVEYQQDL